MRTNRRRKSSDSQQLDRLGGERELPRRSSGELTRMGRPGGSEPGWRDTQVFPLSPVPSDAVFPTEPVPMPTPGERSPQKRKTKTRKRGK